MEIEFGMMIKVQIADFYTKSVYLRSIYLRSQKSSFAEYRAIAAVKARVLPRDRAVELRVNPEPRFLARLGDRD
jgi:hypothetical protein